ncbi:MAG: acyl-CoA desaturase [Polyangiaceae bacterium]|nr:acyl-CoA desaturase [Polyangiaceae bacterium]
MARGDLILVSFFVVHWASSVFFQTFFLHRYGAHRMFSMSRGWERFFHLMTYLTQGPSYLDPRGYAILHRQHHAWSDTEKDPHSPTNFSNVVSMMLFTKRRYDAYAYRREEPEARFLGGTPEWPALDRLGQSWLARGVWALAYTGVYVALASHWWVFLLLPFHYVMGPVHGAIVNWCGHMYGYKNFDNGDDSRNTLPFDFLTFGELFQNNHHKYGMSPCFAARWFEIDPAYVIMRALAAVGIIDLGAHPQQMRAPATET